MESAPHDTTAHEPMPVTEPIVNTNSKQEKKPPRKPKSTKPKTAKPIEPAKTTKKKAPAKPRAKKPKE